jgi:hypothetical protein
VCETLQVMVMGCLWGRQCALLYTKVSVSDGQTPCTSQRKEGQPDTEHTGVKIYRNRGVQRKTRKLTQQGGNRR